MIITSLENEKIKNIIKLQKKKYRNQTNLFFVETKHLVDECMNANILKEVYVLEGNEYNLDVPTTYVSRDVMKKISTTDTVPKIIGICNIIKNNEIKGNRILLLDEIQDPGNLGTIIRSATAFNVDTIILSENTVDLYNPKVLRSTEGMFSHINIINLDSLTALKELIDMGYKIYSTNVERGKNIKEITIKKNSKICLIVGNEGNGVRKNIDNLCDERLYIPMKKNVESLNAAVACSILLYEIDNGGE